MVDFTSVRSLLGRVMPIDFTEISVYIWWRENNNTAIQTKTIQKSQYTPALSFGIYAITVSGINEDGNNMDIFSINTTCCCILVALNQLRFVFVQTHL